MKTNYLKYFLFAVTAIMICFASCSKDDNDSGPGNGGNTGTGSIKVENSYTSSAYGYIATVAVIDPDGNYVKTSTKSINKGSNNIISGIAPGTYTVKITIYGSFGVKLIEKTGIRVTSGGTTTVTFK